MDLARQMIALSGRKDVEIKITGLRPGEKLTEALLDEAERAIPCGANVIEVVSKSALQVTGEHVDRLRKLAAMSEDAKLREAVFDVVAQVRGEKAGAQPTLRVIVGG